MLFFFFINIFASPINYLFQQLIVYMRILVYKGLVGLCVTKKLNRMAVFSGRFCRDCSVLPHSSSLQILTLMRCKTKSNLVIPKNQL